MRELTKLDFAEGSFLLSKKRRWVTNISLTRDDVTIALTFANSMTLGFGEHRDHRSGGRLKRNPRQVFHDTLNGKLCEIALYRWLKQRPQKELKVGELDFAVHPLGTWDSGDLEIADYQFQVKSTKEFGNLLLLEVADWNENGEYKPNFAKNRREVAGVMFVRVRPDLWKVSNPKHFPERFSAIEKDVLGANWEFNIAGFASRNDLKQVVRDRQILPKNALFQRSILIDADNFYIQAGDLHEITRFEEYLMYLGQENL